MWDLKLYLLSSLIMFALILGLDKNETFLNYGAWGALLLIIFLFGSFGTPFSYVFSFLANNAASGFALLIIVNILAGCIAPTAVFMLRDFGAQFDSIILIHASDIVRWVFNWFPIFPFTRALMAITTVSGRSQKIFQDFCLGPGVKQPLCIWITKRNAGVYLSKVH